MGAWIETVSHVNKIIATWSHPAWVRGLKQRYYEEMQYAVASHPAWVRGLKPTVMLDFQSRESRTLRGCVD